VSHPEDRVRLVTVLLLVRHGESEWNALGRWQGQADPPLTDLGRLQAASAARAIGSVDAVVSSDLQRASTTAEIVAGELGVGPVVLQPALRERAAGPLTGLTRLEIDARWPGLLAGPDRPDGFEDDERLLARVVPAIAGLEGAGEAVLVVTHGGVIGAVERHLGIEHERTPNLGGRVVEVDGGRLAPGDRLLLLDEHQVAVTTPPEV
jgi:broad specificity phosphatase PhoE